MRVATRLPSQVIARCCRTNLASQICADVGFTLETGIQVALGARAQEHMNEIEVEDLKAWLPNFPDEILGDWLMPYAKSEGWPPADHVDSAPAGRWRYLLGLRTIAELREISWQEEHRHISIHELRPDYRDISVEMTLAAVAKQTNLYSVSIPDLSERFNSILAHLRKHGSLPAPPVLLSGHDGLQVLDGNHRLAAYFYAYGYFKLPLDEEALSSTTSAQRLWVGTSA